MQLAGVKRLIRRHVSPAQWKEIGHLIAVGIETGRMTSGVFHDVLAAGDEDKAVAYMHTMAVETELLTAAETLDTHLRNQPIEVRLRLRQCRD